MSILRDNRYKWVVYLISLSWVCIFTLPSIGYGDDWVYLGKDDNFSLYYNIANININRKSKQIKVWVRLKYTEKGKNNVINRREKDGVNINNFQNLSYTLELYLYDYDNMKFKILSGEDYSVSGEVLNKMNSLDVESEKINPDSVEGNILKDIMQTYSLKYSNWVRIDSNKDYSNYYDSSSINVDKNIKIIKIWVKEVFTAKGKSLILDKMRESSATIGKMKTLKYSISYLSINYNENTYHLNEITYYAKPGEVLYNNVYSKKSDWKNISSDKKFEFLLNKILQDFSLEK
jgi:hypothetical protein